MDAHETIHPGPFGRAVRAPRIERESRRQERTIDTHGGQRYITAPIIGDHARHD